MGMRHIPRLPAMPDGCGCSSGVEHNLAKVGVEGSNPFARSKFSADPKRFLLKYLDIRPLAGAACLAQGLALAVTLYKVWVARNPGGAYQERI